MNHRFIIGVSVVLALAAAVSLVDSASAQSTGSNGSSYPYWGTAPQSSYRGSNVTVPVPGASPNPISNAVRSSPVAPERSMYRSSMGGGFLPPYLTANDINLSLLQKNQMATDNRAHIWLRVPENAEVWVNGAKTRQSGESRYYFSPPLTPGRQYAYEMRIRWIKDGKPVEETQRLVVSAGSRTHRDFTESLREAQKASSRSTAQK